MKLRHRRQFLHLTAGAAALPVVSRVARAQAYPTRPVRVIVPSAAGGTPDITARLIGQWLSEHLDQPFVIEDRPGAGGNIGAEAAVRATPDGYTLLLVTSANSINAALYDKPSFNLIRDIMPVAGVAFGPLILEVNPSFPAKTVPEFIAYAKANPGKVNFASSGNGTPQHVSGELFKMMAGVDIVHVPYRGSAPALTDLIGGQVQAMFDTASASIDHIKTGRLHPIAVTSTTRLEVLGSVPTIAEFVPGYEVTWWTGLGAPKNTPANIIDRLNKEISAAHLDQKTKTRLADLGGAVLQGSPEQFGSFVGREIEKWAKVVKFAGLKPE
jgi:tripartite-type tricarboxylate transporter receptor subunit TctC